MSRDRLDRALHEKLNRIEVQPPKDMWARLDDELVAMRGAKEQQSSTPSEPMPRIDISIRRPKTARLGWRYIAASVAFATIFGITLYKSNNIEKSHDSDQLAYIELVPSYDPLSEQEEPTAVEPQRLLAVERGTQAKVQSEPKQTTKIEQITEVETDPKQMDESSLLALSAQDDVIVKDGDQSQTTPECEQAKVAVAITIEEKISSEGRERLNLTREQFEREQRMKEWGEKRKKKEATSPISLSLFAGNTTGKQVDLEAAPGKILLNSGFSVDEDLVLYGGMPHETMFVQSLHAKSLKHKFPLSFGLSVSFKIGKRWGILTGITYSYMQSEADIPSSNPTGSFDYLIKQKLHYIGIPLAFKYDIIGSRRVYLYATAGGALERSISAQRKYYTLSNNTVSDAYHDKLKVRGVQMSVAMNLGFEVRVDPRFGIYIEPGLAYYFKNSHQPASYRTENPLNFKLNLGLRVHF